MLSQAEQQLTPFLMEFTPFLLLLAQVAVQHQALLSGLLTRGDVAGGRDNRFNPAIWTEHGRHARLERARTAHGVDVEVDGRLLAAAQDLAQAELERGPLRVGHT